LVIRSFLPTAERIRAIVDRVSALPEEEIHREFEQVTGEFSADHGDLIERFKEHYNMAKKLLEEEEESRGLQELTRLPAESRLLTGAYFTSEYAFEATALFNPSIILAPQSIQPATPSIPMAPDPAPVQNTASTHAAKLSSETHTANQHTAKLRRHQYPLRFILSARSVGEGHVSSISFRTGEIDEKGEIRIDPVKKTAVQGKKESKNNTAAGGMDYEGISFREKTALSERLLFPVSREEQNGIEDARFVRFTNDDGTICYYATYTAYDGKNILPKMIETTDFLHFKMRKLSGNMALNKGMALFPRKINSRYAMLSRVDGESLYIMFSNDLHVWNEAEKIAVPLFPWEFMQIGNCGSPIELDEGWLVLTHGVGSLRRYSIGALLLDKMDPAKVIGRLREPLLSPGKRERTGYVPNVVYTCGSIVHEGRLVIPYGSADFSIAFITVDLAELIEGLQANC
jgi:predicted GH43/DUF377 family glycosyl hydrolase